jgi:ribosomal protein L37AE/L43A
MSDATHKQMICTECKKETESRYAVGPAQWVCKACWDSKPSFKALWNKNKKETK